MHDERVTYGHYCVDRRPDGSIWELGRGAMGVTYQAHDVNLHCPVALKVINAAGLGDELARERFVSEARVAARLRHRSIAAVFHLGTEQEQFFYAMELIDGETVEAVVNREGPLNVRRALQVAMQVASALGAAGHQDLIHRDIKPTNIMLLHTEDEDGPVAKVIDFGLVRPTLPESRERSSAGFVGTPQYASPEQAEERELDIRSDLYSLGCVLWFLLTGAPPFVGSLARVFTQHLRADPPWEKLRGHPDGVCNLLAHLLEKDPARRPPTPAAARREIQLCLAAIDRREALAERLVLFCQERKHWVLSRSRAQWVGALAVVPLLGFAILAMTRPEAAKSGGGAVAAEPRLVAPAREVAAIPDQWFVYNEPPWPDVGTREEPFWSASFMRRMMLEEEIEAASDEPLPALGFDSGAFLAVEAPPLMDFTGLWDIGSPDPFATMNPDFGRGRDPFAAPLVLHGSRATTEGESLALRKATASERNREISTSRKKTSRRSGGRDRQFDPVESIEKGYRSVRGFVRRIF